MPRGSGRRAARWIVRILVSVGIVVYILVDVETAHLLGALRGIHPSLVAAALALYCVGQVLSAYKWLLLGRSVGFSQRLPDYVRWYFVGMFFNLFGLGTLGGDVVRGLYLGEGRRPGLAMNSVLFDRVSGLAVLTALGALALLAFPGYGLPWPLTAALVAGGALLAIGWWTCPRLVRFLPPGNRVRRQVEVDLAPFWRDRGLLVRVVVVSAVFHLTQVAVQWIVARAAGADIPFSYCLVYHPVLSLMTALPVSVGGLGVREGGYLYFLTRIDVDDSVAVTVGVLWLAVTVIAGLAGGALFVAGGATLPRLRAKAAPRVDATAA
ncbi:MAG TPA: lysylphosphatidylglycerol synthase transmembrane domain-containing protein [Candidatus Binatia bacterium]|nr:lysylphosphatidylglycerol synthase transmembrane domain-containing protein [Candidatus Binatia bacterium]